MPVANASYYGLYRTREMSPDAKDWASLDLNPEVISLVLKAFESHVHSGATALRYPGYNVGSPSNPTYATLTQYSTGGVLTPGAAIGVRLAYKTALGLETDAVPEITTTLPAAIDRPLTPTLGTVASASPGVSGGDYVYVMTKRKGSGETIMSDALPVSVPYDTTYGVPLTFDAISTYIDGTDGLYIYRAIGLGQQFQLIKTITNTATTTYTDNGTVEDAVKQPPTTSTFNANYKVRIDWSALTHPSTAAFLKVYVTQQTAMWGTEHLLSEIDLSGSPPTYIEYLGSETLAKGWPKDITQVPDQPAKLNLGTEATGGFVLTANSDFAGYEAQNIKLHKTTSPTVADGVIYYDTSIPTVRARINGSWVNWGTTAATAYTHPAAESGGHNSANVWFSGGSGTTVKDILDRTCGAAGVRKQVTRVYKAVGGAEATTTSSTLTALTDMTLGPYQPDFDNQWFELLFTGHFYLSSPGVLTVAFEVEGSTVEESIRGYTTTGVNDSIGVQISLDAQMGTTAQNRTFKVLWATSTGTATAYGTRRSLTAKLIY